MDCISLTKISLRSQKLVLRYSYLEDTNITKILVRSLCLWHRTAPFRGDSLNQASRYYSRGRSPTAKHGYNSDGESIRHSSHSRSSRGSYGSSLGSSSRRGGAASLSTGSLSTSRPPHHGNTAGATASGTSSKSPSSTHDARLFDKQVEQYKETSSTITSSSSVDTDLPSVMESVLSQDQAAWIAMTTTQTRPTTSVQAVRSKDSDENSVLLAGNYYDESPMGEEGHDDIDVYFKVRC